MADLLRDVGHSRPWARGDRFDHGWREWSRSNAAGDDDGQLQEFESQATVGFASGYAARCSGRRRAEPSPLAPARPSRPSGGWLDDAGHLDQANARHVSLKHYATWAAE